MRTIRRTITIRASETIEVSERPSRHPEPVVVDTEGEELPPTRPGVVSTRPRNVVPLRRAGGGR